MAREGRGAGTGGSLNSIDYMGLNDRMIGVYGRFRHYDKFTKLINYYVEPPLKI